MRSLLSMLLVTFIGLSHSLGAVDDDPILRAMMEGDAAAAFTFDAISPRSPVRNLGNMGNQNGTWLQMTTDGAQTLPSKLPFGVIGNSTSLPIVLGAPMLETASATLLDPFWFNRSRNRYAVEFWYKPILLDVFVSQNGVVLYGLSRSCGGLLHYLPPPPKFQVPTPSSLVMRRLYNTSLPNTPVEEEYCSPGYWTDGVYNGDEELNEMEGGEGSGLDPSLIFNATYWVASNPQPHEELSESLYLNRWHHVLDYLDAETLGLATVFDGVDTISCPVLYEPGVVPMSNTTCAPYPQVWLDMGIVPINATNTRFVVGDRSSSVPSSPRGPPAVVWGLMSHLAVYVDDAADEIFKRVRTSPLTPDGQPDPSTGLPAVVGGSYTCGASNSHGSFFGRPVCRVVCHDPAEFVENAGMPSVAAARLWMQTGWGGPDPSSPAAIPRCGPDVPIQPNQVDRTSGMWYRNIHFKYAALTFQSTVSFHIAVDCSSFSAVQIETASSEIRWEVQDLLGATNLSSITTATRCVEEDGRSYLFVQVTFPTASSTATPNTLSALTLRTEALLLFQEPEARIAGTWLPQTALESVTSSLSLLCTDGSLVSLPLGAEDTLGACTQGPSRWLGFTAVFLLVLTGLIALAHCALACRDSRSPSSPRLTTRTSCGKRRCCRSAGDMALPSLLLGEMIVRWLLLTILFLDLQSARLLPLSWLAGVIVFSLWNAVNSLSPLLQLSMGWTSWNQSLLYRMMRSADLLAGAGVTYRVGPGSSLIIMLSVLGGMEIWRLFFSHWVRIARSSSSSSSWRESLMQKDVIDSSSVSSSEREKDGSNSLNVEHPSSGSQRGTPRAGDFLEGSLNTEGTKESSGTQSGARDSLSVIVTDQRGEEARQEVTVVPALEDPPPQQQWSSSRRTRSPRAPSARRWGRGTVKANQLRNEVRDHAFHARLWSSLYFLFVAVAVIMPSCFGTPPLGIRVSEERMTRYAMFGDQRFEILMRPLTVYVIFALANLIELLATTERAVLKRKLRLPCCRGQSMPVVPQRRHLPG